MKKYEEFRKYRSGSWNSFISDSGTVVSSTSEHTTINNAIVRKSYGAFWVEFKFDYSTYRREMSRINNVYGARSFSGGGTMSLSSPRLIQTIATISSPARAEMDFSFSGVSGVGGYSGTVGITVGNNHGSGGSIPY